MCSIPAESDPCLQIIHFSRRDQRACRRFRRGAAAAGELRPALLGAVEPGAGAVPRLGGQYELRRWGWSWLIGKRGVWVDAEEFAADGQPCSTPASRLAAATIAPQAAFAASSIDPGGWSTVSLPILPVCRSNAHSCA